MSPDGSSSKLNMSRRRRAILIAAVLGAVLSAVAAVTFHQFTQPEAGREKGTSYRPIDAVLKTHCSLGWTVAHAPRDGKRYRIIGAIHDGWPESVQTEIRGSTESGDGRRIEVTEPIPNGMEIEVDFLEPEDGGPLRHAVLTRPHSPVGAKETTQVHE